VSSLFVPFVALCKSTVVQGGVDGVLDGQVAFQKRGAFGLWFGAVCALYCVSIRNSVYMCLNEGGALAQSLRVSAGSVVFSQCCAGLEEINEILCEGLICQK
jgi:hypothetical protein